MGIAPLVAGWQRRARNTPGPQMGGVLNPAGGPGPKVEIYIGYWEDITSYVRYSSQIKITRGRTDEASTVQPQQCTFTLDNEAGRFSPNNPMGPYFGLLGRNTPVRVSTNWNGVQSFRFFGEMAAWPTTWDQSATDVHADVEANGILRRLGQTQLPLKSTMARSFPLQSIANGGGIAAYWPCEDAVSSTVIASGIPGAPNMNIVGSPTLGSFSSWQASDALPVLGATGGFTGVVPDYSSTVQATTNYLEARCFVNVSSAVAATTRIMSLYTTGSVAQWDLLLTTGGDLTMNAYDGGGHLLGSSSPSGFFNLNNGGLYIVGMQLTLSAGTISFQAAVAQIGNSLFTDLNSSTSGSTLSAVTLGVATTFVIAPDGGLTSVAAGHAFVNTINSTTTPLSSTFVDRLFPAAGYNGEGSITRIARLCSEQGIPLLNAGGSTASNAIVGWQTLETFVTLVQECLDADTCLLYEPTDRAGLAVRPIQSLYNQASSLPLDYAQNELAEAPTPTDDDRFIMNDLIVTRTNGSSAEAVLTSGVMSNQAPPNGISSYDTSTTLNVCSDGHIGEIPNADGILDHAWWRVHIGTTSDSRYPKLAVNLRRLAAVGSTITPAIVQGVDIGDRITVDNPPAWLPPDQITQIVQGYEEAIDQFEHNLAFNCSPETPYRVAVAGVAHADTDGSTIVADNGATITVATTNASSPLWTTIAGDFPFDLYVSGERMTCTNITGAASPQTFTVTRSVNGVVKIHAAGEAVRLWQPAILAL